MFSAITQAAGNIYSGINRIIDGAVARIDETISHIAGRELSSFSMFLLLATPTTLSIANSMFLSSLLFNENENAPLARSFVSTAHTIAGIAGTLLYFNRSELTRELRENLWGQTREEGANQEINQGEQEPLHNLVAALIENNNLPISPAPYVRCPPAA